ARVNAPLLVTAPPDWYCSSGAMFEIRSQKRGEFDFYDEMMDRGIDEYFQARDENHWYGLMNFGDTPGGRPYSWRNIEYDCQHGLFTQYFRTGDRRFFIAGEQAARHNADVDVVHHAAGQKCGPGGPRRVGEAWVHSMGHTGGYYPYDYKGMTVYSSGYCENEGHMWNQGNLEYWMLTGDEQVHRSAMQLGDWLAGPDTVDFGYGNARVPGWMGIIAMSTYFATCDDYYLNAMRLIYEEVQDKGDKKYGLWVHKLGGGHCRCEVKHYGEAGFMAGVLMTALKYFYYATGDEEVARRIVKIADFITDTMWVPERNAFRYTSCPKTGASPILTMITANGQAFAANYAHDEKLMQIMRGAFIEGLMQFERRGAGAQIMYGLPICSAPMAMYEIGRFPGPSLRERIYAAHNAALNPAARPTPGLIPNPDFEETGDGWRTRRDLVYERTDEVAHTGRWSARASGHIQDQGEYLVTWYSCGPPWEIQSLQPGGKYRIQLWLRVDHIGEGIPAPTPRVAFRSHNKTRGNVNLTAYDLSRLKQWQMLEAEFEVPEGTDAIYIAVSTMTKQPQDDVLMYLDDIAIVPADTPRRDVYVYPAASGEEAALSGDLTLTTDEFHKAWQAVSSPKGGGGSAVFTLNVPIADDYRFFLRAKAPKADATVSVSVDGRQVGTFDINRTLNYRWLELSELLHLEAGAHEVTVTWPKGSVAVVQKLCLTNEPRIE
ncbi:MAG: hypothetical protein J7M38_03835, partial [Armatimonadetes bacterium]|nr:hypothetical protein [Armatimonadota bacterium]